MLLDMLGCLVEALVDTGSDRSFLGACTLQILKMLDLDIHKVDEPKRVQLADGSLIQICENVEVGDYSTRGRIM